MTSPPEQEITSFVLRFVRESDTDQVRWRGRIRHVQSDQELSFVRVTQALRFMHEKLKAESPHLASSFEFDPLWHDLELEE